MGQGIPVMRLVAFALAALFLGSCGTDKAAHEGFRFTVAAAAKVLSRAAEAPAPPVMTRAVIDQGGHPLIRARIEKGGAVAFLGRIGEGRGVITWASVDGLSISLRDGVVIATRGMGADLMSSDTPAAAALARDNATRRRHYYLFGGDSEQVRAFECILRDTGPERITVVELVYDTRHRVETCTEPGGLTFENHYWFDNRAIIRQSRQWISPTVGFLELQDLNR